MNILKDIKSGALPLEELPGFLLWLARKGLWLYAFLIVVTILVTIR